MQIKRHRHYARIYVLRTGQYLLSWKLPTTKPNAGCMTFIDANDLIDTYSLYETLITKFYETDP